MAFTELKKCLCCDSEDLKKVINLGDQPLANNFHDNTKELPKYPLQLNVCTNCFHCQLSIAVDPALMFTDYKYVSGTTDTLKQYFKWFANYVMTENPEDIYTVLDIGCNDGSQLDEFKNHRVPITVGIEPSTNLSDISKEKGHYIENQYFNKDFKFTITDSTALFDCIIAQNVFAHNSNPLEFLQKCEQYLNPDRGVLYIQVSQADMIKNNEFDTIYHEHISFFNINSMNTLIGRTKTLCLVDVIKTPIHGNSYIFVIKKKQDNWYRVDNILKLEAASGLYDFNTYHKYANNVFRIKNDVIGVAQIYKKDRKLIGYGAAAKGMTALNYFGLKLDYIIDDNELKQGLYTPGGNIPIYGIDKLKQENNDPTIIIPLAWNFYDEIKKRIERVRSADSRDLYIKYFPKVEVRN